ncbi:uncharacterized protein [Argopecten irradians]|uniref:uncharacterized protein n=1 Tax=Argopecten irradians TaxID=31199 RepID=UPI00371A0A72
MDQHETSWTHSIEGGSIIISSHRFTLIFILSTGSPRTWHGRADIVLNHTIAVSVGKKTSEENEDDDTNEDEPRSKHRKLESTESCDMCGEVKANTKQEGVLTDMKVLKQIFALAITNGFAQVNRTKGTLTHFLIPTIGVTSDHVSICLYDPENDYLLHSNEELELWCSEGETDKLNFNTVIVIWLFLNFTLFTQKQVASLLDLDKSGLHEDLKHHLKYYKNAETKANYVSLTPVGRPWKNAYLHVHRLKQNPKE